MKSLRVPGLAMLIVSLLAVTLNASESLSITRRATWPGYEMGNVMGICATGSVVWLGSECYGASIGSLLALDVHDPASPVVLSSTPTGGGAAWAFDNGFAYAVNSSSSASYLEIYDLADVRQPVRRARLSIAVGASSMTKMMAHQGYLWLLTDGGVETFDVRNPSAPQHAGSLLWADSQRPSQVYLCGDFGVLMTTHYGSPAQYFLRVIDLKDPAKPAETDSMQFSVGGVGGWPFLVLSLVGDYIYYMTGAETGEASGYHVRAARVTSMGKLESTAVDLPVAAGYGIWRMWSMSNCLYFAENISNQSDPNYGKYRLRIIDVSERLQPKELPSCGIMLASTSRNFAACDGHMFLSLGGIGGSDALQMLDATNPAQPVDLGTIWRNWGYQRRLYGLAGTSDEPMWLVRDDGTSRIRLFAAADILQGNPAARHDWNLPFVPGAGNNLDVSHVLVHSNHCYVLSMGAVFYPAYSGRLDVFDLSVTGPPVHKWTRQVIQQDSSWGVDPGHVYHTTEICGDKLYLTYWPGKLDIYSLSTPAAPQFVGSTAVGLPDDLEIHNGYAYLFTSAGTDSGGSIRRLEVVDVRDPAHPSASTIFREYSGVWHGTMVVDGDLLYLIYFKNGSPNTTTMDVFDLTNPLNPTRLSSTPVAQVTYYAFNDIAIQKPYAILAGPSLLVVDVSDPSHPAPLGTYDPFPQLQNYTIGSFNQVKAWQNHIVVQNETLGIEVIDVGFPLITRQPASRTHDVGTTASFNVEASGGPSLVYQWRKDGTNLLDDMKFTGVTTTNLLIANVQLADAAGYSVVVTNAWGSMTSIVAQLTVTIPPSPGRFTHLSYSPETGLSFIFRDGTIGQPYRIQVSPSLEGSWVDWESFTYNGPKGLMDVNATGAERRFYRAVSP